MTPPLDNNDPIAHVSKNKRTHLLVDHLQEVGRLAGEFARDFQSSSWAEIAGRWHDLGKYSKEFQAMIQSASGLDAHIEAPGKVDHSTAGALLARDKYGKAGWPIAFCIAGHHAGLADMMSLNARLYEKNHFLKKTLSESIPDFIIKESPLTSPSFLNNETLKDKKQISLRQEFWIRMLYSTLVDADFLDTERFHDECEGGNRVANRGIGDSFPTLKEKLDSYMGKLIAKAENTPVNKARMRILEACVEKAHAHQGIFSLSAPTGVGKTLAAMAFAVNHVLHHKLKRVIVVIPYTSIIEQNANVYRHAFGKENIVEHHASIDPEREDFRNRLACENWDAPIIVTTSVQFLESLLANRSSHCRKLHNIIKSVVIFDEVQSLPIGHLTPILDLLKELTRSYHVSIVLSTATQPALGQRSTGIGGQFGGFEQVNEIVPDPLRTFAVLKRADIIWPKKIDEACSWENLAGEIERHERVLAIVHRREDARTLTKLLPEGTIHLSALMCAAHRLQELDKIRKALKGTGIVRVVSTQLVEAGVDVDFPIVFRAFGGLDAIAQAAGRCNREGKLPGRGIVHIFVPPTNPPRGTPRTAYEVTRSLLLSDPSLDPLRPDVYEHYFRQLYFTKELDASGIQSDRASFKFRTVAENFKMIEDDGSRPIVVPFGDAARRLSDLRNFGPNRERLRSIQPYIVNLYPQQIKALEQAGALEIIGNTVRALLPTHAYLYSDVFGLVLEGPLAAEPSSLFL